MRSFIIHMPDSTARQANAERLCDELPSGALFEAVNGRDPAQISAVKCHNGDLYSPNYPFALRPAEIGVFQSHRRIWQKMVDEKIDLALITEDDLQIDPVLFPKALEMLERHATIDQYIRLPVKQREAPGKVLDNKDGLQLILPRVIGLQCICQVVGRRAAVRLLEATQEIDRPVDTFLQMHWITQQPVHALLGTGNLEVAAEIGGTTIQQKTPTKGKLARELKRAFYRARVFSRPQKG
ncbi:MAG: glycosyl transferase family 25 [Roseobacter sp. MedPE-SWchi]|nr:MAG: glycosyl transferase family 25 [Roseobacter sp. MedPE-SWchi]